MSKSDPSDLSRINLSDDRDTIAKKIRKAKTDPEPLPSDREGLEGRPEADNLVGIYAALAGKSVEDGLGDVAGQQFSSFKETLTELAVETLAPVSEKMQQLMGDPSHIDGVLGRGAERARTIAAPILRETKEIIGFIQD